MIDSLLARQFVFCGGKGGVGKTTMAASLGMLAARQGRRVLVVSTDPAHSLGDLLEIPLDDRPTPVAAGLEALEIDPERAVDAYLESVAANLREYVHPRMYPEVDRQMARARQAPGAAEAAMLERMAGLLSEPPADTDLVIFDTAPTGHALRLLSLPEAMAAWTEGMLGQRDATDRVGRVLRGLVPGAADDTADVRRARLRAVLEGRRQLFVTARAVLTDRQCCGFVLVLTPERLALEESARALGLLGEAGIDVAGVVVNQVLPDAAEGAFVASRRQVQRETLERIRRDFGHLPLMTIPLAAGEIRGLQGVAELADGLEAGGSWAESCKT